MSRLQAIARRDLPGWILLALGILLVIQLAPESMTFRSAIHTGDVTGGASPFLPLFSWLGAFLPSLRTFHGPLPLVNLGLDWLIALGMFYCVWRLTRNRVVSLGAGFLMAAHPMAIGAMFEPAGLRDLVAMAFIAWLLALNAQPRFRSSRFPNLPPPASSKLKSALMGLGILSAPGVWIAPLLLLAMDIPFHREPGRGPMDRNWRSYLPHGICLVLGLLLEVFWGASAQSVGMTHQVLGFSENLNGLFLGAETSSLWSAWAILFIVIVAVAIGVLEALFDMGRRRLTLPYVGFAGFAAAVAFCASAVSPDARLTGGAWMAFFGFAVLIPIVGWRILMSFFPPEEPMAVAQPRRLSWPELVAQTGLTPLPDLGAIPPAPRLEEWQQVPLLPGGDSKDLESSGTEEGGRESLAEALGRIGVSMKGIAEKKPSWDPDFCRQELEPLLTPNTKVLAFLPSRSPYAAMAASLCGSMTILERGDSGFPGLEGFDHVHLFDYDGRRPWPAPDQSCDLIFSLGVLSQIRTPELQGVLAEFERILSPDGEALLVFKHMDTEGGEDDNPLPVEMAADFCRQAGLPVDSTAEAINGHFLIRVRRKRP